MQGILYLVIAMMGGSVFIFGAGLFALFLLSVTASQ